MQILFARLFSRITPTEPTFGLVANEWLDSVSTCVKRSTYSVYSAIAAKYIPLGVQAKPITSVTAGDIHRMLYEAEHPSGREALSSSRMHTICTVINSILDFARDRGLDSACRPVHHSAGASRPSVDPLTGEEQTRLEQWLVNNMDLSALGVLICLYTGLRLGEICAMKWGDISYADKSLRVRRTVQRIRAADAGPDEPKTRLVFDSPKSAHSNRVVPVPGFLLEMAESFRCADETYILTGEEDRCLDPRTYQNRFYVMLRRAGVRKVSFHTLRHTFATNCVDMGCDPKTLCEILGHSDVSITLNIYVHPSVPAKRELIEQLSSRTDITRNKVQKLRAPHMRRPHSIPLLLFAAVPVPRSASLSPCRRL